MRFKAKRIDNLTYLFTDHFMFPARCARGIRFIFNFFGIFHSGFSRFS